MYYVCWQHSTTMETGRTDYTMTREQADNYINWQTNFSSDYRYWLEPA